ncbi:OmpA family protein [Micromonospora sp. NPDC049151]|uniref:OmpA family protein n=1 Tax=Micromonospora sp. NPDC049151 TaxID=3155648 RepID=UPI0033FE42D7
MTTRRSARIAALALCVPLVGAIAGCIPLIGEEFTFNCPQPAATGLGIAVGARANSPAPALTTDVRKLIVDTMNGCGKITTIRVDGRPSIVDDAVFGTQAKTKSNFAIDQKAFLDRVGAMIANAKAGAPEANVLKALSVASDAAGPGGTVVLVDSGVQTTAPLDFRRNDLLSRRPEAVAKLLRQQRLLPDLRGRKVIMTGLGYTAMPQEQLDDRNRSTLVNLWREIVLAAGAKDPVIDSSANTADSAVTSPTVSVVRFVVGDIRPDCDTLAVFPDSGAVGFVPDEAELRDPAGARKVLATFVAFLRGNPTAQVVVRGYVAHYGAGDLSQRRADRVKREFVALGATNRITAKGMGWGPYPSVSAPPDERYDQKNRMVTIEVSC